MSSFYLWSIEWNRKNETEDLDSVNSGQEGKVNKEEKCEHDKNKMNNSLAITITLEWGKTRHFLFNHVLSLIFSPYWEIHF